MGNKNSKVQLLVLTVRTQLNFSIKLLSTMKGMLIQNITICVQAVFLSLHNIDKYIFILEYSLNFPLFILFGNLDFGDDYEELWGGSTPGCCREGYCSGYG